MRIDNAVNRIGYWCTGFGLVAGAFTWLSKKVTKFGEIGWPEATIAGFLLASVVAAILALGLIAWRFFRPLPERKIITTAPRQGESQGQTVERYSQESLVEILNHVSRLENNISFIEDRVQKASSDASSAERHLHTWLLWQRRLLLSEMLQELTSAVSTYDECFERMRSYLMDNDRGPKPPWLDLDSSTMRVSQISKRLYGVDLDRSHPRYTADPFIRVPGDDVIKDESSRQSLRRFSDSNMTFKESISRLEGQIKGDLRKLDMLFEYIVDQVRVIPTEIVTLRQSLLSIAQETQR